MVRLYISVFLLLAVGYVKGHFGGPPPSLPPVLFEAEAAPFTAVREVLDTSHRPDCKATCNGEAFDVKDRVCLGDFKVVCHVENKGCAVAKCTGLWQALPDDLGVVCEGEMVHMHAMTKEFHDKQRVTFFGVAGCRGAASVLVGPPDAAAEELLPRSLRWDGPADPPGGADPFVPGSDFGAGGGGVDDGVMRPPSWGNRTMLEARCDGGSLEAKGMRLEPKGQAAKDVDADRVEELAMQAAAEAAPGLLRDQPPPPSTKEEREAMDELAMSMPSMGESGDDDHHPVCQATCNGHPSWLMGAFPCWGEFRIVCDPPHHGDDDKDGGNDKDDDQDVGGTLLPPPNADRKLLGPVPTHLPFFGGGTFGGGPGHEGGPDHHHCHPSPPKLDARCRGVWSGRWLGSRCYGVSIGQLTWREGRKVSICSNWMKVLPPRSGLHGGHGMATLCDGKNVVVLERESDSDEAQQDADVAQQQVAVEGRSTTAEA